MSDDQIKTSTVAPPAPVKSTISLNGFFDKTFAQQGKEAPVEESTANNPIKSQDTVEQPLEINQEEQEPAPAKEQVLNINSQNEVTSGESVASANPAPENQSSETKFKEGNDKATALESGDIGSLLTENVTTLNQLGEILKENYIPKIVAAIINYALNCRSSDVHIEPQIKSMRLRMRIDGILTDIAKLSLEMHPPIVSRIKILSKMKIDENRIPQDGRFEVTFADKQSDVRVSTLPTVHGEKVVMRILDKNQKILTLEDLGLKGDAFDKTIEAINKPWGVILSTGPTGSGKSTSLNAIIARLNKPGVNICTLEDPVEYETPGVNQSQVKPEIGFTFATGLRSLLRQDPNIIMVGEIRDAETAGMATHAALTGHLVLTTLHTNDTAGALPRLINMGIEPFLITSSMNLIMAQRLVRLICPKCKEEIKVPPKLIEEIQQTLKTIPVTNKKDIARIPTELKFYYGRGCTECKNGYKGRLGLFEVMGMTDEIEDMAIGHRPASDIKVAAIKSGMITIKQDGLLKALEGLTTLDEVLHATMDE